MRISNRQRKILKFFRVPIPPGMSGGACGWEIGKIMADDANRDLWERYLYITKDFSSESDELMPFDQATLASAEIPDGWKSDDAIAEFREKLAEEVLSGDASPFDRPQPEVVFAGSTFVFTGKFAFGLRKECQEAVVSRGGTAKADGSVSQKTDYLVIGAKGSNNWKKGSYGRKIEAAIVSRREHGKPAIISEEHWTAAL